MSEPRVGAYVTHTKMPELGSGEIIAVDDTRVSIRFASGLRNFVYALVEKHLTVTTEAPPLPASKPSRARAAKAAKSDSKTDAKSDAKSDTKSDTKSTTKSATKSAAKKRA